MIDGDLVVRHSDATLAAFGLDSECDDAAYEAAASATFEAKCGSALLMGWARMLAATHARTETPLQPYLDRLKGEVSDEVRDVVRRQGRVLINTARVADDGGLGERWVAVMDRLDDRGLSWLGWTMAAAAAPVARTMGGLGRFVAALEVVQLACRGSGVSDASFADISAVSAALAAVAAGDHDAAEKYVALPDLRSTLTILIAVIPGLLRGKTAALMLEKDGIPHAIADPADPDMLRLNAVIAAATSDNRTSALAAVRSVVGEPDDAMRVKWYLTLSLGTALGQLFIRYERDDHRRT